MAEQYDHQSSKQLIFMEWNLRADAGGLMKCKIFSNESVSYTHLTLPTKA